MLGHCGSRVVGAARKFTRPSVQQVAIRKPFRPAGRKRGQRRRWRSVVFKANATQPRVCHRPSQLGVAYSQLILRHRASVSAECEARITHQILEHNLLPPAVERDRLAEPQAPNDPGTLTSFSCASLTASMASVKLATVCRYIFHLR